MSQRSRGRVFGACPLREANQQVAFEFAYEPSAVLFCQWGTDMTQKRLWTALAVLALGLPISPMPYSSAAAQQTRPAPHECRDYRQQGIFGGGVKPSTPTGRTLTQCRKCWYEVRRHMWDKKVCERWPDLPTGSRR
jgi:hypothetical protein